MYIRVMDDDAMDLRWRRQRLRNTHQEVLLCTHEEARPRIIAPYLVHRRKTIWEPGPSIRECCILKGRGLAIAAWWWEVEQRYAEIEAGYPGDPLSQVLYWQLGDIEKLLEDGVPKPSAAERQQYIWYREDLGLVREAKDPPGFRQLGLSWPCAPEALEKRFRELARTSHPDRGGNAQQFSVYAEAYRTAKLAFERRP